MNLMIPRQLLSLHKVVIASHQDKKKYLCIKFVMRNSFLSK